MVEFSVVELSVYGAVKFQSVSGLEILCEFVQFCTVCRGSLTRTILQRQFDGENRTNHIMKRRQKIKTDGQS